MRRFHFSLDFPTIDPSNPSETRGKVDPHCKSYAWVPVLWSFDNSRREECSPTWLFLVYNAMKMVLGVMRPRMVVYFGPKEMGLNA